MIRQVMVIAIAAGLSAMAGCCCGHGGASHALLQERESQVVREDQLWSDAAASGDAAKVAAFYAEDVVVYPPNSPMVRGRAEGEKAWAGLLATPGFRISWSTQHSGVARAGDIGWTSGWYTLTMTGPDGQPVADRGKYLCIWQRQVDGSWKSIHDMWNTDLPMH